MRNFYFISSSLSSFAVQPSHLQYRYLHLMSHGFLVHNCMCVFDKFQPFAVADIGYLAINLACNWFAVFFFILIYLLSMCFFFHIMFYMLPLTTVGMGDDMIANEHSLISIHVSRWPQQLDIYTPYNKYTDFITFFFSRIMKECSTVQLNLMCAQISMRYQSYEREQS